MSLFKVALTGGIGSGKSYVADVFKHLGVPVFESDIEAKKLYYKPETVAFVKDNIDSHVVDNNGIIDLAKLANVVFNNASKLSILNGYIHPQVMSTYLEWSNNQNSIYAINESAIVFENKLEGYFDFVISVIADKDKRIERVMKRNNVSEDEVQKRMSNQVNDSARLKNSNFIVDNNEEHLILPQIVKINEKIIQKLLK